MVAAVQPLAAYRAFAGSRCAAFSYCGGYRRYWPHPRSQGEVVGKATKNGPGLRLSSPWPIACSWIFGGTPVAYRRRAITRGWEGAGPPGPRARTRHGRPGSRRQAERSPHRPRDARHHRAQPVGGSSASLTAAGTPPVRSPRAIQPRRSARSPSTGREAAQRTAPASRRADRERTTRPLKLAPASLALPDLESPSSNRVRAAGLPRALHGWHGDPGGLSEGRPAGGLPDRCREGRWTNTPERHAGDPRQLRRSSSATPGGAVGRAGQPIPASARQPALLTGDGRGLHGMRRERAAVPTTGTLQARPGAPSRRRLAPSRRNPAPRPGPMASGPDDHRAHRRRSLPASGLGFRMLLESQDDIDGGPAEAARAAREAVRLAAGPSIRTSCLMDVRMPPAWDGIEATRRITSAGGRTRVLILTTFDLDEYAVLRGCAPGPAALPGQGNAQPAESPGPGSAASGHAATAVVAAPA